MLHIRYKLNLFGKEQQHIAYTVVVTDGWTRPLDEHPSIVEHPESFEIVDAEIPQDADYLIYES